MQLHSGETFRDVIGYEGKYRITSFGRVLSYFKKTGWFELKQRINNQGYYKVELCKDCKQKTYRTHRLVAGHFLKDNGFKCVNHKDGNKLNNHLSNLEFCDHSYNLNHARKIGLRVDHGEDHHFSKITEKDVRKIRELRNYGSFYCDIAEKFSISVSQAYNICSGKSWKHIM